MRRIGMNLQVVRGLDDNACLREMAALGFTATFMKTLPLKEQETAASLCAKYGILCETLHAPFSHINDIWFPGEGGDAMLKELMECVDHCPVAGAKIAVVHLSSGVDAPPVTDAGRLRFARLVEYAEKKGVKMAFENQRKLANLAWAMETFSDAAAGFCWDCGHEQSLAGGMRYMPLFGKRILTTHIHDNHGVTGEDEHLIPFDGTLDYNYVAKMLQEANYHGTLMLELYHRDCYSGMTPEAYLERAARAAERLRSMVDGERES